MATFLGSYAKSWMVAALLAAAIFWMAGGVVLMLIAAIVGAVFLRGAGNSVSRRLPISPIVSVIVVLVATVGTVAAVGYFVEPIRATQFAQVGEQLPPLIEKIHAELHRRAVGRWILSQIPDNESLARLSRDAITTVPGAFRDAFGGLFNLFLSVILAIYLALEAPRYVNGFLRFFPAWKRPSSAAGLGGGVGRKSERRRAACTRSEPD